MKRLFALLTLAAITLFASCGSDDDKPTGIVGTWIYKGFIDPMGNYEDDQEESVVQTITFKADHTGTYYNSDCEEGTVSLSFGWLNESENIYNLDIDNDTNQVTIDFEGNNKIIIRDIEEDFTGGVYERK